ncbi:MAG: 1-deoxy-D-xylulose-5-phosphate synthase [Clostridia bacterium]|nr:1-deoxy-D-xylulose-5-phosphate synthase [Clostridia bacterium]
MYLEKINSPKDIKNLKIEELNQLSEEIRKALMNRLTKMGGHFGPNFGIVETIIAMHYVFESPKDKFVFDVSHQTYTHKMLTGRKNGYLYEEQFKEVSGYTNPEESEHDFFNIGHTSTSISLASGLAKARDLKGDNENIIAVIGDGSLSGGEAFEGLNYVGSELGSNFIIVVNDNQQSIAENHGGIYKNLEELRKTNGTAENNLFKAMGLDYIYENEGNNIEKMIKTFEKVKNINHPIVIHINTKKGKGFKLAEENREIWHWCMPFDEKTGKSTINFGDEEDYATLTADLLLEKMKKDKTVVAVTPAMPTTIGFNIEKRKQAGSQFVDVGIAEEHAIALISGIARNGAKPILGTNATFIQRTYDQISQDLCINNNPATIVLNYTSVAGLNDVTHLGIFTISAFSHIPNLVILAPTNKNEYMSMLDWSIEQNKYPVMILMPGNGVIKDERIADKDYSNINKYKIEVHGERVAIIAAGDFYQIGEKVLEVVKEKLGFTPTLINPRYLTGLDNTMLEELKEKHKIVITLEDGLLDGGFGTNISSYYGTADMKVKNYGLKKEFIDRYDIDDILKENCLTPEQILKDIEQML